MQARPPRDHLLSDFRMEGVRYELRTLAAGEQIERRAGVAGYFYHVLDGQVMVSTTSSVEHTVGRRDTVMVSGFRDHRVDNSSGASARLLIGAEPHEYVAWMNTGPSINCFRAEDRHPLLQRLLLAMDIVVAEISDPQLPADQLTLERTAELILFYFIRMANPDRGRLDPYPWNDRRLMAAVSAMTQRPQENWTVERLAAEASMSRSAFAARFRDQIGESPMQMLTRIRLKAAAGRLSKGEPMENCAESAGYGSVEAFNRAFKRTFGMTPGRWSRAHRLE